MRLFFYYFLRVPTIAKRQLRKANVKIIITINNFAVANVALLFGTICVFVIKINQDCSVQCPPIHRLNNHLIPND